MPPEHDLPRRSFVDPTLVRLAIDDGTYRVYLSAGDDSEPDAFSIHLQEPTGGSGAGHPRWVLRTHGVSVMTTGRGGDPDRVVCGAASDLVERVTVNRADALLRNNAYLAVISESLESIEITTPDGTRLVPVHPRMR